MFSKCSEFTIKGEFRTLCRIFETVHLTKLTNQRFRTIEKIASLIQIVLPNSKPFFYPVWRAFFADETADCHSIKPKPMKITLNAKIISTFVEILLLFII